MFLWYPVLDLARAPRRTARKKGSGYENGGGAEEANLEGLVDFPTTRPKLPWNCPDCEVPNYCVLKQNYLQLNSEFKPIQVK